MRLTKRETEVCYYMVRGYSTREIAKELQIGVRTTEDHRAHLLKKYGCKNAVQLVLKVLNLEVPA